MQVYVSQLSNYSTQGFIVHLQCRMVSIYVIYANQSLITMNEQMDFESKFDISVLCFVQWESFNAAQNAHCFFVLHVFMSSKQGVCVRLQQELPTGHTTVQKVGPIWTVQSRNLIKLHENKLIDLHIGSCRLYLSRVLCGNLNWTRFNKWLHSFPLIVCNFGTTITTIQIRHVTIPVYRITTLVNI